MRLPTRIARALGGSKDDSNLEIFIIEESTKSL